MRPGVRVLAPSCGLLASLSAGRWWFIEVVCKRPKKPANVMPIGDVDNYAKAALDAITSADIWADDKLVVEMTVRKRYTEGHEQPHTFITIQDAD